MSRYVGERATSQQEWLPARADVQGWLCHPHNGGRRISSSPSHAGDSLGTMPPPALLTGVLEEVAAVAPPQESPAVELSIGSEALPKANPLVPTGPGLPALLKKLVARIWANEYVDFSEFPPAKGKVRALSHSLEGQVILVQAEDLLQSKRLIPDLPTWVQCFAIYATVLTKKQPARFADLMAYASTIATPARSTNGLPGWSMTRIFARKRPVTQPSCGQILLLAFIPNASWAWRRVRRVGVKLAKAWTTRQTIARQGPPVVPHASDHAISVQAARRVCL